MGKAFGLVLVLALALCACKGNRWYGKFSGNGTEVSTILRAPRAQPETPHGEPPTLVTLNQALLEREGKVAFITFRGCRVRLDLDDPAHAHVSEGQTCAINFDDHDNRLAMKGTAGFDSGDMFTAEITGTPTVPTDTGEYSWKFAGARTP